MSVDICFKEIKAVCQGKTLCRQRVPKGSSSRKKIIPIKILNLGISTAKSCKA